MIITLRSRQRACAYQAIQCYSFPIEVRAALNDWCGRETQVADTTWEIQMPYVGWQRVAEAMMQMCFTRYGRRNRDVKPSAQRALQDVQKAINFRSCHPSLSDGAAIGAVGDWVPAWQVAGEGKMSPHPVQDGEFCVLSPLVETASIGAITIWQPDPLPPEHPLFEEAEHWRFVSSRSVTSDA